MVNPRSEGRDYTLKERLFTFFMGLNPIYEGVRVSIVNQEKNPRPRKLYWDDLK